ncbi:hypothetical protein B0H19DRAFT_1069285 [Mycena capillaripes]|nr:hypothetical protein B0H19DRAFT_1069285 [Mycena capillaripes]
MYDVGDWSFGAIQSSTNPSFSFVYSTAATVEPLPYCGFNRASPPAEGALDALERRSAGTDTSVVPSANATLKSQDPDDQDFFMVLKAGRWEVEFRAELRPDVCHYLATASGPFRPSRQHPTPANGPNLNLIPAKSPPEWPSPSLYACFDSRTKRNPSIESRRVLVSRGQTLYTFEARTSLYRSSKQVERRQIIINVSLDGLRLRPLFNQRPIRKPVEIIPELSPPAAAVDKVVTAKHLRRNSPRAGLPIIPESPAVKDTDDQAHVVDPWNSGNLVLILVKQRRQSQQQLEPRTFFQQGCKTLHAQAKAEGQVVVNIVRMRKINILRTTEECIWADAESPEAHFCEDR